MGDQAQLPPTVLCHKAEAEGLGCTLFARMALPCGSFTGTGEKPHKIIWALTTAENHARNMRHNIMYNATLHMRKS